MTRPLRLLLALAHRLDQALNEATLRRAPGLMKERTDRVSEAYLHRLQDTTWRTR